MGLIRPAFQLKYWFTTLAGMVFAVLVWKIMTMDFRFGLALTGGLCLLCLGMVTINRIDDLLVYALVFSIPFSMFGKWLFGQPIAVPAKGISLGPAELLLLMGYGVWFVKIFVARSEPLPHAGVVDYFILFLLAAQGLSLIGAPNAMMGAFDIIYNVKHALLYLFIAHKVKRTHLKGIVALFLGSILLESGLALYERLSGNVGIGLAKFNPESTDFGRQYETPGIEELRAAGTTNDSHTLGLYYTMLLPFPFVLSFLPTVKTGGKLVLQAIFVIGLIGLVVTFSRAGWLSLFIAIMAAIGIIAFWWRQKMVIVIALLTALMVAAIYPKSITYAYSRLVEAPAKIMEYRYDTTRTAFDIWRQHPIWGYGAGNYIDALSDPDIRYQTAKGAWDVEIPVHNALLWIAAELGVLGVLAFFGLILISAKHCLSLVTNPEPLIRGLALAIFIGFFGYLLDGITDPMFREPVPYAQLWVSIGLAAALRRLAAASAAAPAPRERSGAEYENG